MYQGSTLAELAAEVERQADSKADFVADTRRLGFTSNGSSTLTIDGANRDGSLGEFTVTEHTHGQIAQRLSIPKPYYDRMRKEAPELLDRNVRHWFTEKPERRMIRTLDGNARAFLSDRYRRLDNIELANYLLPVLGEMDGVKVESCGLTDTRLYIKATLPTVQAEIKVGDPVCSGVVISNSEIGAGRFLVETLIYRLICLNGAITGTSLAKHHLGRRLGGEDEGVHLFTDETLKADDEAFFLAARDLVKAACSEIKFAQIVADCKELAALRVEGDPVAVTEKLAASYGLNDGERSGVLRHLIEGGDLTAWGYVNSITRASQDADSYDRATELERLGGSLIELPASEWAALAA